MAGKSTNLCRQLLRQEQEENKVGFEFGATAQMSQSLVPFERLWGIPHSLQLLIQKAMGLPWSCISPETEDLIWGVLKPLKCHKQH